MATRIGSESAGDAPDHTTARRRVGSFDEEDSSGYKRQRTALACESCRHRKSRCNGDRPVCATCTDMGLECVYRRPAPAPSPRARDMASIETRLHLVEDLLRAVIGNQQANPSQAQSSATQAVAPAPQSGQSGLSSANGAHSEPYDPQRMTYIASGGIVSQEDTVDGMVSITFADESSSGYFGPTSNSCFFKYIARALASGTSTVVVGRESPRDLAANLSRPPSPPVFSNRTSAKPVNPYVLPRRTEILRLLDIFFSITGMFFPYIHKNSVTQMIDELDLVKFNGVRKSSLCLLNALLAIGTSLDGEKRANKFREAESDVFFQRALVLSPGTISNTTNLEALQALALMTQYLQGSSRSAQTWRLHGLLVQAAFQMGVHTADSSEKLSLFEKEIRKRTWHTCIVLDRVHSMTFGRPPLIHNELIQVEMPLDVELDDLLIGDSPPTRPHDERATPSSCALFIASIDLYQIQGDIVRLIYNHNIIPLTRLRADELLSSILKIDHRLSEWKTGLYPSIKLIPLWNVDQLQSHNWAYTKTETVLTLRYLNVRVLLLRKILENALDDITAPTSRSGDSDVSSPIAKNILQICVDSAMHIITLIRTIGARPDLLPAWWFTAYYVFNSALIIFGVICLHTLGKSDIGSSPPADLLLCLRSALEALDIVGKETRIVRRCSKYLKKMIQISISLGRNIGSAQRTLPDATAISMVLPEENPPSITDDSTQSPLETDFGQFLIDDDFNFLDMWTDVTQQPPGLQGLQ